MLFGTPLWWSLKIHSPKDSEVQQPALPEHQLSTAHCTSGLLLPIPVPTLTPTPIPPTPATPGSHKSMCGEGSEPSKTPYQRPTLYDFQATKLCKFGMGWTILAVPDHPLKKKKKKEAFFIPLSSLFLFFDHLLSRPEITSHGKISKQVLTSASSAVNRSDLTSISMPQDVPERSGLKLTFLPLVNVLSVLGLHWTYDWFLKQKVNFLSISIDST